jgi:hypothetical protein
MVTYVLKFFATMTISYSFLYKLATYYWKAFEKGYNFVLENMSIKIHMKKLHKDLNAFASQGNLKTFSLEDIITLWGNLHPFFWET